MEEDREHKLTHRETRAMRNASPLRHPAPRRRGDEKSRRSADSDLMNVALSDAQAFSLVLSCAVVAVLAIAMTLPRAAALTAGIGSVFALWLRDAGGVAASTALLLLALLAGTIVRQRRERALEQERLLTESIAAADARREAEILDERARLAREIHDVLAHTLAGLMIQLERTRLLAAGHPGADDVVEQLERAHEMAAGGLADARNAVGALRGDEPMDESAIRRLTRDFADATGLCVDLTVSGEVEPLGPERQLLLYRTVQEALTNAAKHASPTAISVRLDYRDDEVTVTVENDGGAAAPDGLDGTHGRSASTGFGLQGMSERVALAGGHFDARPTNSGFLVAVRVPR